MIISLESEKKLEDCNTESPSLPGIATKKVTKIAMKTKKTPTIFYRENHFIMDAFSGKEKICWNKNKNSKDSNT